MAGLRRDQVARLEAAGVPTLTALAELPERHHGAARPARHAAPSCGARQRCSCTSARTGEQVYELLPYQDGYGFGLLPEPASGDLFFDIEGDPYIGDKGLEYLFGVGWLDEYGSGAVPTVLGARPRSGATLVRGSWSTSSASWLARAPGQPHLPLRPYEEQALKTLAMYHGTREDEIDDLLRSGALVDLFRVVRQGLRISKDSYSLKQVEEFYWHEREAKVKEAGGSIVAYERWLLGRDQDGAGRDRALQPRGRALHARPARLAAGAARGADRTRRRGDLATRPRAADDGEKRETADRRDGGAARATARDRRRARRLLGELLLYHRREAKPGWWWYFERLKMSRGAAARRRRRGDRRPRAGRPGGHDQELAFGADAVPAAAVQAGAGSKPLDPVSERGALEILALDAEQGTLELKLGPGLEGRDAAVADARRALQHQ